MKTLLSIIGIIFGMWLGLVYPNLGFIASEAEANTIVEAIIEKPTPTPTPTREQIINEVMATFKDVDTETLLRLMWCFYGESRLNPNAVSGVNHNGTRDAGLAQINDIHGLTIQERLDLKINLAKAKEIFDRRGFSAWYSPRCHI